MKQFNLSEWALKHRSLVVYLMIVAVAAGVLSYFRLGRNEDPTFIIKTMVVQGGVAGRDRRGHAESGHRAARAHAGGDAASRLPAQLHHRRRHHDLRQSQGQRVGQEVADTWYHVRKSIGDMRHTLPSGVVGPVLQRRVRRHVRHHLRLHRRRLHASRAARLCRRCPLAAAQRARRLQDRDSRRAGRADLHRVLDAGARQPRASIAALDRRAAGAERRQPGRRHPDRQRTVSVRVSGAFQLRAGHCRRQFRRRRAHAAAERHRRSPPRLSSIRRSRMFRVNGKPAIGLAIAMRDGGDILALGDNITNGHGEDHRRSAGRHRADPGRRSGRDGRARHRRVHDVALAGGGDHPGGELHQPRHSSRLGRSRSPFR